MGSSGNMPQEPKEYNTRKLPCGHVSCRQNLAMAVERLNLLTLKRPKELFFERRRGSAGATTPAC